MATRKATAIWNGTLKEGNGVMKYGQVEGPFTFASRFEEGKGTNPEETSWRCPLWMLFNVPGRYFK